tara:strand:+ start:499 stop:642 length:144 start_codon:yes stop_codon:yes gene_type:complete
MGNGYKGLIKPQLNKNQNGTSNNDNTKGQTKLSLYLPLLKNKTHNYL